MLVTLSVSLPGLSSMVRAPNPLYVMPEVLKPVSDVELSVPVPAPRSTRWSVEPDPVTVSGDAASKITSDAPETAGRSLWFAPGVVTVMSPAEETLTGMIMPASRKSWSLPPPKFPMTDETPLNVWFVPKAVTFTAPEPALLSS